MASATAAPQCSRAAARACATPSGRAAALREVRPLLPRSTPPLHIRAIVLPLCRRGAARSRDRAALATPRGRLASGAAALPVARAPCPAVPVARRFAAAPPSCSVAGGSHQTWSNVRPGAVRRPNRPIPAPPARFPTCRYAWPSVDSIASVLIGRSRRRISHLTDPTRTYDQEVFGGPRPIGPGWYA